MNLRTRTYLVNLAVPALIALAAVDMRAGIELALTQPLGLSWTVVAVALVVAISLSKVRLAAAALAAIGSSKTE